MSPVRVFKRIFLPLFMPYFLFVGCSVVGLIAGSASSPSRPDRVTVRAGLDSLPPGTDVNLVLFDRTMYPGSFAELARMPARMYRRMYDTVTAKAPASRLIPKLGQTLTVFSEGGKDSGTYAGVSLSQVLILPPGAPDTVGVPIEEIVSLQLADSLRLDGNVFRKQVRAGTIPGWYVVVLNTEQGRTYVGYETVDLVQVIGQSSGALKGFLIGAAVDLTVIILANATANRAESDCSPRSSDGGSCSSSSR